MRFFYFFLPLLCFQAISAQSFTELVNSKPKPINELMLSGLQENQLFISMPFAKKIILNPEQKRKLNEKVTIKLELVYTKFKTAASFNQKELNKTRLIELQKLVPNLFINRLWHFGLISQSSCNSRKVCNNMPHGFLVTFRPNSTNNTLKKEATYLNSLVRSLKKKDSLNNNNLPKKYTIKTRYDLNAGYKHDTLYYKDTVQPPIIPDFFYLQSLYNDTSVLSAFRRNPSWKNFIVITDVTGSMSPYSAQVIVWLKKQAENSSAKYFVFFNDGDEKDSKKKKPLETKGIYITKNKNLDAVINSMTKCMLKGSGGGESLENDIEAIMEGQKQYPKADEIILIADNMESMRDYEYIKKIKKPVHIILCGSENRINIQYLDLARQTNGSVHTPYSDIYNLQDIKEKEHFFIDEKEYTYNNGRFHSLYSCPINHANNF